MLKWRGCTELLKPLGQTASSFCASVSSSVNGDNNCVSRIGIHGMICRFVQKCPWVVVPDCLVQAGSNWSHCLHLSWDAEPSPAWDSHEIVAFLFLVGTEDGRLQCAWAAGLPSNWCKWLASKLRLPACVRGISCSPHVKTEQQEVAPFAGKGSFYWCKVPPNRPSAECSKILLLSKIKICFPDVLYQTILLVLTPNSQNIRLL